MKSMLLRLVAVVVTVEVLVVKGEKRLLEIDEEVIEKMGQESL